jgi:hypothetical protein
MEKRHTGAGPNGGSGYVIWRVTDEEFYIYEVKPNTPSNAVAG